MNINTEIISYEEIWKKALQEIKGGGKKHPFCESICREALLEMKLRSKERPYSRLFYELAFFYREEKCLENAYKIWRPVMRKWIIAWDYELMSEHMDDVIDELIYAAFDALFLAVFQSRFIDFSAGKVHNFFKNTLHLKVFAKFKKTKEVIVSRLNIGRNKLKKEHCMILKLEILPLFKKNRPEMEMKLFELYLLSGIPLKNLVKNENIFSELGNLDDPLKALHNRNRTMLWNVYKLIKRESSRNNSIGYQELLFAWIGAEPIKIQY